MPPKFHILDGFPKSMSPSSHAVEADGFVFLTGQFGRDLDHPEAPLPAGMARVDPRAKHFRSAAGSAAARRRPTAPCAT
jgi:enamine deaminase RidA (YjgF/YER057c/UK114 family)